MTRKRILVIITEGETDEEFYKKIIEEIKKSITMTFLVLIRLNIYVQKV